jgi:CHAD domain-containing protein
MKGGPPEAFTLSWHKKSADSFALVLRRMADRAHVLAGHPRLPLENSVHELRLLIKRTRALLWFAQPALPGAFITRAKQQLRRGAQQLAGRRDLRAADTTLRKIFETAAPGAAREAVAKARLALTQRKDQSRRDPKVALAKAAELIGATLHKFADAVEHTSTWPSASGRTEKAFRLMRRSEKKARQTKDDADFHAWRKKAKRLLFLLEMRDNDRSVRERRFLEHIDRLQAILGEDHDCRVAAEKVVAILRDRKEARVVTKLLGRQQDRLRRKTRKLTVHLKREA